MRKRFLVGAIMLWSMVHGPLSIAQDSLELKIGQMLLIGMQGTQIDPAVLNDVRQGRVGSIIIFEMSPANIPSRNSFQELKKITWTYQKAAPIPLFISIDQEGGRVNRLKEKYGFPRSVTAAKLGKYALDSVQFYGETTAATLAGLGINVNFAPVVDLASNPTNPIIAKLERAYSANPDSVALVAREFIRPHRKFGVVTVLKHFPGHGSSKGDTHLGLTDVTSTWNENELIPYQQLIASGDVDAIMTAHIVNKKLDDTGLPGTLSKKVIAELLRTKMNYQGVVFSDAMEMHAIAKNYSIEEAVLLAINAGVDILCFAHEIEGIKERTTDKVHGIIRKLVESGAISRERIDQSFKRIMELKMKMNGSQTEYYRKKLIESESTALRMLQLAEQQRKIAEENAKVARENEQKAMELVEELKKSKKKRKERK
jgi:beta-N-acetylhexosaminidase